MQCSKPAREQFVGQRPHRHRNCGQAGAPQESPSQYLVDNRDQARDMPAEGIDRRERERRKVFERVAVGQHQPINQLGMVSAEDLAQRTTGVVADERDVLQLQPHDQFGDHVGKPGRRQVCAVHR